MKIDPLKRFKLTTMDFLNYDGEYMQNALEFFYTMLDKSDLRSIVSLLNRTPYEQKNLVYGNFRKTFCISDDDIHEKYEEIMKGKMEDALIDRWISNNF